ncbi:hypothetical protein HID58_054657 [Brassica napus]|uniref:Secreted protein n=1 Tax=Brassica napus TaxID=3708 RepID=A0ABQ8AIG5_BRANA|nr:hypothetical protein HID58_054657 [Brassica napus]
MCLLVTYWRLCVCFLSGTLRLLHNIWKLCERYNSLPCSLFPYSECVGVRCKERKSATAPWFYSITSTLR